MIRTFSGKDAYAGGENFVVTTDIDGWAGEQKPPLIYCHGSGGSAYKTDANRQERQLLTELAKDYVVVSGDWGGDQFGSDTAMGLMNDGLAYIRNNWNANSQAPVVIGGSMGACTALNYALDFPVTCVAAAIPLTDLTGAWEHNLLSLGPAIDSAYGGTYDPAVHGPRNDPNTFASLIPNDVPICLFPSSNDPYLANVTAHQFVWNRPATKLKSLGAVGHSGDSLGLGRQHIISFVNDPSGFVGDAVPEESASGPNLFSASTSTMEGSHGWTNYAGTLTPDTTQSHSGTTSLKHVSTKLYDGCYSPYVTVTPGVPYKYHVWAKGSGSIGFGLFRGSTWLYLPPNVTLTTEWTKYEYTYTPKEGEINLVVFPVWSGAGTVNFDDAYIGTAQT